MIRKSYKVHAAALALLMLSLGIHAQGIRGEIRDENGAPVPYAAIFIKELTRGTTCNALGKFSLPLPEGSYTVFFRSMGYREVSRKLEIGSEFQDLQITLPPQTYMIPEVRVSASGEDPAYFIMRKAIGLANYHLNEVQNYQAEIYIKGSAIIDRIPKAIEKRVELNASGIEIEEGKAYMLESFNEVRFTAPDKYEMKVLASQNTLPGYTDNVNPMDYINASLYQQEIEGVVSPLARSAFSHYRFEFEGTFLEGTHIINKIRVTPKRKSQQLMEGTLFIVEDSWCLHSSDLSVETMAGNIFLEQLYANVIMDAWLPVSHKLRVDLDIVGVRARVTYVSSLEYKEVLLNPNLPEIYFTPLAQGEEEGETQAEKEISKEQEKINELLQQQELSNRDVQRLSRLMEKESENAQPDRKQLELDQTGTRVSVADRAVRTDSAYWKDIRPIPLTPEEQLTIKQRDSVLGTGGPRPVRDSTVSSMGKPRPFRWLLRGHTYTSKKGRFRFTHDGLLDVEQLNYNTVDGFSYGQQFRVNWKPDTMHTFRSTLRAAYAFHRKAPLISWGSDWLYAPMARGKVALYLNYQSSDFNGSSGIPKFTNLDYTLILRENYLKKYEHIDATLYNRIDLTNGLVLTTSATLAQLNTLQNHSQFSIFYRNSRDFSENRPSSLAADSPALSGQKKLQGVIRLDYTPRHPYVVRNRRKAMRESKWPTFSLEYRQALPLEEEGWSQFSLLNLGIDHRLPLGLLSTLDWQLDGGYFFDKKQVHFSDFRHFKSSPLYLDMNGFDQALMLMDYYEGSSSDYWVRAGTKLTSSYLLLKFLPWFSERLWNESIGMDYLYTPQVPHYIQAGYSLNEVFFLLDIGVYAAFQEGKFLGIQGRLNFRF